MMFLGPVLEVGAWVGVKKESKVSCFLGCSVGISFSVLGVAFWGGLQEREVIKIRMKKILIFLVLE